MISGFASTFRALRVSFKVSIRFSVSSLVVISTIPTICTKFQNFCLGRAFVNPSAIISVVGFHSNSTRLAAYSCLSQCWCILTCRSFVFSLAESSLSKRRVWVLSQWMVSGSFNLRVIALNRRLIKIASFAVCERERSSASVLEVVTVSCLFALHAIAPPKSVIA